MECYYPRRSLLGVLLVLSVTVGAVAPVVGGTSSDGTTASQDASVGVVGLDAPAEATAGASIAADATVENTGDAAATRPVYAGPRSTPQNAIAIRAWVFAASRSEDTVVHSSGPWSRSPAGPTVATSMP